MVEILLSKKHWRQHVLQPERNHLPKSCAPFAPNPDPTGGSVHVVEKLSIATVTVRLKIGQNIRKLVQKPSLVTIFGLAYTL